MRIILLLVGSHGLFRYIELNGFPSSLADTTWCCTLSGVIVAKFTRRYLNV